MKILYKHVQGKTTGYGRAAQAYIEALKEQHDVFLQSTDQKVDVTIHHVPPEDPGREGNGVQVGLSAWETTKLPEQYVRNINACYDIQIVPSTFNKEVYENSGVVIPIYVIPHIVRPPQTDDKLPLPKAIMDKYKFFSVFQWTPRKNPKGLLKGYFSAFYNDPDVVLILKVHRSDYSIQEQNLIKAEIKQIAHDMRLAESKLPKIFLITQELSDLEMDMLYNTGDCFVLPHRGEGFGLPIAEAMAHNKQVIATEFGGPADFMLISNGISYMQTPVSDMPWIDTYDGTQLWAEPDLGEMMHKMMNSKLNPGVTDNHHLYSVLHDCGKTMVMKDFNQLFMEVS